MPKFVEQATTYGYGKAGPYVDTACEKVPFLQTVVKRLLPYAKPSVQLADTIVDRVLDLASKPVQFAQATATSIRGKTAECKAVVAKTAGQSKDIVFAKISECKTYAALLLRRCESWVVEKKSALLHSLQTLKVSLTSKLGQAASWTGKKLEPLAARLHLTELWDMARAKMSAWSKYLTEARQAVYNTIGAWTSDARAFITRTTNKIRASAMRILKRGQAVAKQ